MYRNPQSTDRLLIYRINIFVLGEIGLGIFRTFVINEKRYLSQAGEGFQSEKFHFSIFIHQTGTDVSITSNDNASVREQTVFALRRISSFPLCRKTNTVV